MTKKKDKDEKLDERLVVAVCDGVMVLKQGRRRRPSGLQPCLAAD